MAALHRSQPAPQPQAGPGLQVDRGVCRAQEGFVLFLSKLWRWELWLWPGSIKRVALMAAIQSDR